VNKQGLIDALAERLGLTKGKAAEITDAFFGSAGIIASELRRGGRVAITGFGSFETRRRAAREGRNPRTGKTITLKASTAPAFKAGKALKELVNKKR
jgi:DNA-binding protein HU-beta